MFGKPRRPLQSAAEIAADNAVIYHGVENLLLDAARHNTPIRPALALYYMQLRNDREGAPPKKRRVAKRRS